MAAFDFQRVSVTQLLRGHGRPCTYRASARLSAPCRFCALCHGLKEHGLGWNINWTLDHICMYMYVCMYIYIYVHMYICICRHINMKRSYSGHTGHNLLPSFTSNSGRFNRSHNVLTMSTPWPHLWKRGVREPQIRRGDKEIPRMSVDGSGGSIPRLLGGTWPSPLST